MSGTEPVDASFVGMGSHIADPGFRPLTGGQRCAKGDLVVSTAPSRRRRCVKGDLIVSTAPSRRRRRPPALVTGALVAALPTGADVGADVGEVGDVVGVEVGAVGANVGADVGSVAGKLCQGKTRVCPEHSGAFSCTQYVSRVAPRATVGSDAARTTRRKRRRILLSGAKARRWGGPPLLLLEYEKFQQ